MHTAASKVPTDRAERLLRRREVENRTGLSRSTIYLWMSDGLFPKPRKIGPRAVAWRESDIQAWIEQRPEGSA
ncbi:helix-turn-helix transcriptional regulator [Marinobacter fonticola]|uniref:helix-turn-helix transcriptional regulator n=1 Tax=Marinobacter fonticola TaxID=2603215 RepID=UPI0011E75727|nr:AlpA family transcriptional regulator [Marinobacter fonticola]